MTRINTSFISTENFSVKRSSGGNSTEGGVAAKVITKGFPSPDNPTITAHIQSELPSIVYRIDNDGNILSNTTLIPGQSHNWNFDGDISYRAGSGEALYIEGLSLDVDGEVLNSIPLALFRANAEGDSVLYYRNSGFNQLVE